MELNDYVTQIAELQKELDKVIEENKLLSEKLDRLYAWGRNTLPIGTKTIRLDCNGNNLNTHQGAINFETP
jgi:regulator of replication initiation timing